MFKRRHLRPIAAIASISMLAGCGALSSGDSDGEEKPIVVGTSSVPSTLDPAASWDGSWELFRNIYQTLLSYPSGAAAPEPDAAERCKFTDSSNRVYHCELREGLTFSDGDPLTAKAVKYSIDRIRRIDVDGGPDGLLTSLDKVVTKGDREVFFHLDKPDATFPFVLATPAMSIVDPGEYPADKIRDDGQVTGSGPYELKSYRKRVKAELVANDMYDGYAELQNEQVTIRYYRDSAGMVEALRKKDIDATYRGLDAKGIVELRDGENKKGIQLFEGSGTEISYLVFNPKDKWAGREAVRKAVAQILDRTGIARKVYKDTVEPLYSMVPRGLAGHTTSFFDAYGHPDAAKAKATLREDGITEPVPLTFWYPSDRYGSGTKTEFVEIQRQLNATGLFEVKISGEQWDKYEQAYRKGEYPVFGRGWFPDFPDADNFIAPFVGENNALSIPYDAPEITDRLLPSSRRESDRGAVVKDFRAAQRILMEDAQLIPLWQGKQYVAFNEDIGGVERALDPSTIMLMWELHRKTSW